MQEPEERLNGLALLYIYRDVACPAEDVVAEFARRHPRLKLSLLILSVVRKITLTLNLLISRVCACVSALIARVRVHVCVCVCVMLASCSL